MEDEISRMLSAALAENEPAPLLSPLTMPSAADEITDRLITTIALGEFQPGSRLPAEREMAAMLKVSRTTIREAIKRIASLGIVEIRRGRTGGAYVRENWSEASAHAVQRTLIPRWAELEQLFDTCALVEAMIARTAAERRTDADVAAIKAALAGFAEARTDAEEQLADQVFHRAILTATGNPQLAALNQELVTRISLGFPFEPWRDPELGDEGSRRAMSEHTLLTQAIATGDAEAAWTVAKQHSSISAEIIKETLDRAAAAL